MQNINDNKVLFYFKEISKIPRESGNEEEVSNWIAKWAKDLNLEVIQDHQFNLIIKKSAAKGYEHCKPIVLQAHMDMVCEKTPDSNHDFKRDPITLKIDGDWIVSASGTSLGADNGIGVACAMAILADPALRHPLIEVIFTVEEETTFRGAETISPSLFQGRRMINLDHADDNEIIAGSCGGEGLTLTTPLIWEDKVPANHVAYKLRIAGLKGGHSGEDIHRGRGNAIGLLIRALHDPAIAVASVSGGTNRLAIPREAEATVLVKEKSYLLERIEKMQGIFQKEYGTVAPSITIELEKTLPVCPLKLTEFEKVTKIVRLFPNGIVKMSGAFEGVVESSINLGVIDISEGGLSITAEARGLYQSNVEDITEKIVMLAQLTGSNVELFGNYPPWEYTQESELRSTALKVYKDLFERDMKELIVHAGLECGAFAEKVPEMDIIAIGPCCQFFHSPNERTSIRSIRKFYKYLTKLLESLE